MINCTSLKVIHWEYNMPVSQMVAAENLVLLPIKQGIRMEGKKAIKIRITYRLRTQEFQILSYIGESSIIADEGEINEESIKVMIAKIYFQYEMEFENRKVGTPLQYNFLKPFNTLMIEYEPILRLLQEP